MDVNESIVKILEKVGVDHVFGGSGQVNASMLLALKKSEKIKTIIVKNEQAASFMACGYSMYSDKLGVCFATGGPGAFNLFSGMAVAYSDSLPVLAITGYTSSGIRGKGALNESTGLSRTPDSHAMFSATTKKSYILENAEDTCDILEEAISIAFDGRPGPVHIHIPKNITMAEVKNYRDININIRKVLPEQNMIKKASDIIEAAMKNNKNAVLLLGYGAIRSHAEDVLLQIVDKYKIPFMTTMDAKGILPEDHELSLGVLGTSGDPGAFEYFKNSEVVIAVGNSFAENATFAFKTDLYDGKKLIHINIDPHEINKVYKAEVGIESDAKLAAVALMEELAARKISFENKTLTNEKYSDTKINNNSKKIHPAQLTRMISDSLPENSIIMGDAGAHMLWLNCYLKLTKGQLYQNPGSFGPMASNVNGSMGVKCANPDRPVICACGDGDYLMAGFELLTAVENNIPVIWIIFNNGEFNIIKKFLLNIFGEHAYMEFMNPDYVKYAEACGATGYRVEKAEDFEKVFHSALQLKKPVIIDVVVDPDVYPPFAMAKV